MRCKNCGWPNKPGETVCVKCNSPLDSESASGTRIENSVEDYGADSRGNLNATIPESAVFGGIESEKSDNVCPKCGYPLRGTETNCPNCNYPIRTSNNAHTGASNSTPKRMENPSAKKTVAGTINPYMVQAEQEPTFILKPQQRINEKKVHGEMEYEGSEVILNRDNTDPENGSITSQQQAIVYKENGHWYIEDKSGQGTTFVRASKRIELTDGDTILLGNRLFEFHE